MLARMTDGTGGGGQTVLSGEDPSTGLTWTHFMPPSRVTSLVSWDDRIIAVTAEESSASWTLLTADGAAINRPLPNRPYASLDVSRIRDHVVVAGGEPGRVSVVRGDGVSGLMPELAGVSYELDVVGYDGTRVAVASARERVAVAWLTSSASSPSGTAAVGYALLSCEE